MRPEQWRILDDGLAPSPAITLDTALKEAYGNRKPLGQQSTPHYKTLDAWMVAQPNLRWPQLQQGIGPRTYCASSQQLLGWSNVRRNLSNNLCLTNVRYSDRICLQIMTQGSWFTKYHQLYACLKILSWPSSWHTCHALTIQHTRWIHAKNKT